MASRPVIIASLLGASVGVPYAISNMPKSSSDGGWPFAAPAAADSSQLKTPEQLRLPIASPGSPIFASQTPLEGAPSLSLEQVFRFDITKDWVYRAWARKTTGVPYDDLFGIRVPLVTGKSIGDMAGSLTYFFDGQGLVQHISFNGRTGDTARLIDFLVRNYKFHRSTAPAGEQLFQVTSKNGVHSELRSRSESVLWSTSPHSSFTIELELARPGSKRVLTPRIAAVDRPPN